MKFYTMLGYFMQTKVTIVNNLKKLFLPQIEPKITYNFFLESTVRILLTFSTMIDHYL